MDIATVSAAIGSIKAAADIAKFIKDSDFSLEKAEAKLKMAELIEALVDAKLQMAEVQEQMRELEAKLQVKGKVEWRDPAYWVADGPQANGPCCQKCYDTEGKLVRLQDDRDGTYSCMACKCQYSTPERRSRIVAALSQSRQKASGPY